MRWFGAISILWGVLMHPYFSVYWAVLWAFAYWHHCYSGNFKIGIRSLLLHLNVPLLISGTALFFLLGAATWLRPGPEFSLDPFQWIANDGYWKTFFDISQFQFLRPGGDVLTILVLASLLAFTFLNSRIKSYLKPAIAPLVLIIVMLAVTLLLTYLSMYRDYWILPRQWVASIGLVAIGFVWMVAEVSRVLSIRYKKIAAVACFSLFAYVVYLLMPSSVATYKNLEHVLFFKDDAASYTPDYLSGHAVPTSNDEWVALAKANIEMGGAVWPVFREFYGLEE
jgi:hypothetical protein